MVQVKFKGLKYSTFLESSIERRMRAFIEKFPELQIGKMTITVEMENSPFKRGPDQFRVKLAIFGGKFSNIVLTKRGSHPYLALAELADKLLEKVNRYGDKCRVRKYHDERRMKLLLRKSA